jgi:hypothetical protein
MFDLRSFIGNALRSSLAAWSKSVPVRLDLVRLSMTLPFSFSGAAYAVCDDYFGPLSQDNKKKFT